MSAEGITMVARVITSATAITTSSPFQLKRTPQTFQATVVTTSTGANAIIDGKVTVLVSNDNVAYLALGTLATTGSGTASDGFTSLAPWAYTKLQVTSMTTGVADVMNATIGS